MCSLRGRCSLQLYSPGLWDMLCYNRLFHTAVFSPIRSCCSIARRVDFARPASPKEQQAKCKFLLLHTEHFILLCVVAPAAVPAFFELSVVLAGNEPVWDSDFQRACPVSFLCFHESLKSNHGRYKPHALFLSAMFFLTFSTPEPEVDTSP